NGFMRIVISVAPQTSSTSPISAKRPMLGSKKAPSLVGGAKDYKRHSRKPNTCFRSRAIPGARIGSRKKSPAEAGQRELRKGERGGGVRSRRPRDWLTNASVSSS